MKKPFAIGAALVLCFQLALCAVSADVTLRGNGQEYEADSTQRTTTITGAVTGGSVYNKSSGSIWIDLNGGTVVTSSGSTSIECAVGIAYKLPKNCKTFNFKTAGGSSYFQFVAP